MSDDGQGNGTVLKNWDWLDGGEIPVGQMTELQALRWVLVQVANELEVAKAQASADYGGWEILRGVMRRMDARIEEHLKPKGER